MVKKIEQSNGGEFDARELAKLQFPSAGSMSHFKETCGEDLHDSLVSKTVMGDGI